MNEGFFGGHLLRSESEGEGYVEGETFRNGDNDQSDKNDQDVGEGNTVLAGSTVRGKRVVVIREAGRGVTLTVWVPQCPTA